MNLEELFFCQKRYKSFLLSRDDIKIYDDKVIWKETLEECLKQSSEIVVAVNPHTSKKIVHQALKFKKYKQLFLEKPLCADPVKCKSACRRNK